jgi:hypothetical protein
MSEPAGPAPADPAPSGRPRRRLTKTRAIGLGLVLTLVGLFVLGGSVPTDPATLERAVAITGVGAIALWLGGIFLGASRGR